MKPVVLLVSQAGQRTGLARVTCGIAVHLAPYCDMHVLGIDCFDPQQTGLMAAGWTLHHNPLGYDVFAEMRLEQLLDTLQPDTVVLYNDVGVIERYFHALDCARHRSKVIGYCPVDGEFAHPDAVAPLLRLDALAVFTEFGRNAICKAAAHIGLASRAVFQNISVIPHGLDLDDFHPCPPDQPDHARRRAARCALLPGEPQAWDGFWVLNANRNQPRKRLDLTLEGFARFAAGKPDDVRLYLHTGMQEIGIDILRYAEILGISRRLLLTRRDGQHPDCSSHHLNLIYNACDVGVNTAIGEGWGLVSCEHGATMSAQIVPRHSACAEIWHGAALLMEPAATVCGIMLQGRVIDPDNLADALQRLYDDPEQRRQLAKAAHARVNNAAYRWPQVAAQWNSLLNLCNQPANL